MSFVISGRRIGPGEPCFIIAEAGVNHNGELKMALELVDAAAEAGADCIKFQAFSTEASESSLSLKPSYFDGRDGGQSKLDFSRALEFNREEFAEIAERCRKKGIIFLSMAADLPSLELLVSIGSPAIKIGSSDTNNVLLQREVARTGLPVILSTGISTMEDVKAAVSWMRLQGAKEIALLQCTSQYPSPCCEINLRVLDTFRSTFSVPVGISDHSSGLHIAVAAVARGANIVEKHFTLSRKLPGVDHLASVEPQELKALIGQIREVETALGDGVKRVTESEAEHLKTMRKSLFAARSVPAGTQLSWEDITVKRPGTGLTPPEALKLIGRRVKKDIAADTLLKAEVFDEA
ncbi:MAG: hypothetical protein A2X49_03550 [Lentisphaerae bacterium GWF2_52_8]|nr:MAG: hypothetical protein A2X49_03550 [Lentisphaerae bacterium GWF2_52_8]